MWLVVTGMLLWAIYGHPPYAFYSVMKWAVAGSLVFHCRELWRRSRELAPLCLVLATIAGIHIFGKMRREEWTLFNWSAIAALGLAALVLTFSKEGVEEP